MPRFLRIGYGFTGWKTIGAVVALVLVSLSVWQWLSGFSGPEYRGKPVRAWVREEVMSNSSPNTAVIGDIGADAVPHLVNWLSYEEGLFKSALLVLQRLWPGSQPLPSPLEIRLNALYLLGTLGANAVFPLRLPAPKNGFYF